MRLCAWCKKDIETGKQLTDVEYKEASKEATDKTKLKGFVKGI